MLDLSIWIDWHSLLHMPSVHATILRTNSGSSCRWLRMIPSLGTIPFYSQTCRWFGSCLS